MSDTSNVPPAAAATDAELFAGVRTRSIVLLGGLCLAIFFWKLGYVPFYVRGEPREGLVVQEMHASGDWILPAVNGSYVPFKPPLYHWAALAAANVFGGIDEFTLRFPSALFATLGVLLVYFAGARLWGEKAGAIAAVILATSHEWWNAAALAQVDMTLAFFMAAGLLLFLFIYLKRGEGVGASGPMAIAFLLGCATLAKGPVGVGIPALVIIVFLALRRDLGFLTKMHPLPSAAIFCLVAVSWYALALREGGQAFFLRQIVNENFRTAVGAYGHYQSPLYFIPAWLSNMLPWTLFLPAVAVFAYRRREWFRDEKMTYLLVWFVCVFLVFSLARGKRAIYILSLYPAVALLFGAWWVEFSEDRPDGAWLARAAGYTAGAFCLAVPGVFLLRFFGLNAIRAMRPGAHADFFLVLQFLQSPPFFVRICLAVTAAAGATLIYAAIKQRWNAGFVSLAVASVAASLTIKQVYFPAIAAQRTLRPFMADVRTAVDRESAAVYTYRSFDYGAVFYAARHLPEYPAEGALPKPPFYLLMWESEWERVSGSTNLQLIELSEGLGANKRQRMALVEVTDAAPALQGRAVSPDDEE